MMSMQNLIRSLKEPNSTKIVLLVADGLGGLPIEPGGKTELEIDHLKFFRRVLPNPILLEGRQVSCRNRESLALRK